MVMNYQVFISNGYIISIVRGVVDGNITESEYLKIKEIIKNKPTPPAGFDYKLRQDLTWKLFQLPDSKGAAEEE